MKGTIARRLLAASCALSVLLGSVPVPLSAQEAVVPSAADRVNRPAAEATQPAEEATPPSAEADVPAADVVSAPRHVSEESLPSAAPDAKADGALAQAASDEPEAPAPTRGWVTEGNVWRYLLDDGSSARGIYEVDGVLYVFDLQNGNLLGKGWHQMVNTWCYADAEGRAHTGWLRDGGHWYWFDAAGVMAANGLREIDGRTYAFAPSGVMRTGWVQLDGSWRYFDGDGSLHTGWLANGGTWYWLDANGVMAADCLREIGGKTYAFDASGAMRTGWVYADGSWWYFGASGAACTGWLAAGNTWYYLDDNGRMHTGWLDWGGRRYWLDQSGAMVTGMRTVDGQPCCFDASGVLSVGWVQVGSAWYHMADWHRPTTGWFSEGGVTYWCDETGMMATGWRTIDGIDRWFSPSGACDKTGWQNPHGLYVVSTYSVQPYMATSGIFSYITPSRVKAGSTRAECIEMLVQRAQEYLGTPYVWDYACAPGVGVDCAGLVMQCLYAIGMNTPYNPWSHYYDPWQDHNAANMLADDKFLWVDAAKRERGDIVFWPGHCALYLGNDQCIEAWPSKGVVQSSIFQNPDGGWRTPNGYRRICV